jgi:hypothetical protein
VNLTIGFSIETSELAKPETAKILNKMLDLGCTAIQIHGHSDLLTTTPRHLDLVKQFGYRTLHLPQLHDQKTAQSLIDAALKVAESIEAQDFTLHPEGLSSFAWLSGVFGQLLSIENMDWRKDFGKSTSDLEKVFTELPNATWTCDVNHIKTNDSSMGLADDFYQLFKSRLKQYHLSGFVDTELPHTLLADTKQDEIIAKIQDKTKAIIIESLGPADMPRLKEEFDYIIARL